MKKIEKEFLKDYSLKSDSSYEDIKKKIVIEYAPLRKRNLILKYSIISLSCVILMFIIGFSTYRVTVEAAEYREAIEFFNENDLETEGLSRNEIKNVYKDIKTNSFTYDKTGEVINNTIATNVEGYEISANDYSSVDLKTLWDYWYKIRKNINLKGIYYKYEYSGGYYENSVEVPYECRIVKYEDSIKIWEYDITNINVREFKVFGNIIIGYSNTIYDENKNLFDYDCSFGNIIFLNAEDGSLLYEKNYTNYPKVFEKITTVIDNKDNTYTMISSIDQKYLCLTTINSNAEIIETIKKDYTKCTINCVTTFEDGYLILFNELYYNGKNENQKIAKIDKQGNLISEWIYSNENSNYIIKDMTEFENKIFISCYEYPKQINTYRSEIDDILDYLRTKQINDITDEEVTLLIRNNYKSLLLVCDFDNGIPQVFYSVDASIGGELTINDKGNLIWNVENILSACYSPATSAYTIAGICNIYEYSFNKEGLLLSRKENGITNFMR